MAKKVVGAGKKVAPAPKFGAAATKSSKKDWKSQHAHLFSTSKRVFTTGRDIQPKRDLSRMVKWPRYIRVQRQRAILKQRIKVPPSIDQFRKTLDKNQATNVLKLLAAYKPETKAEKKARLAATAGAEAKGGATAQDGKKPHLLKFGLNHITTLIEQRKAKLVVIAHDVDPIELVVWLPALCRKKETPYCIIKGKARLGKLVHKKTAAVVAVTSVRKEDEAKLNQLVNTMNASYLNSAVQRKAGGGIMGIKAQHVQRARARQAAAESRSKLI